MNKFNIKNQEEKVECLMWISDLYKDVYGFRPRGYNFEAWSFQELTDFVNNLLKQSEEEEEYELCTRVVNHIKKLESEKND